VEEFMEIRSCIQRKENYVIFTGVQLLKMTDYPELQVEYGSITILQGRVAG
jgi:hypothetical protein